MAPKSRLSTTSTRKWAKCFSGSQSRKEGGKSRSCFKLSERKHLAMAASYNQTILWKATFLILLANFCESISDRLLGRLILCFGWSFSRAPEETGDSREQSGDSGDVAGQGLRQGGLGIDQPNYNANGGGRRHYAQCVPRALPLIFRPLGNLVCMFSRFDEPAKALIHDLVHRRAGHKVLSFKLLKRSHVFGIGPAV